MRLLTLNSYCFPEVTAASHLSKDLQEAYVKDKDITLEIYTPYPSRGVTDEVRREYIKDKKNETLHDGKMIIHRYPLMKEGKGTIQRFLRYMLLICKKTYYGLKAKDCDVLFTSSTPPVNGIMMCILKKFKKYKIVYNLQDIFPDSMCVAGMTKKGSLLWKIGRFVENKTYKAADKILVISEDFKKNIMQKGVPEEKIEIVYNWIDENEVVSIPRDENTLCDKYDIDKNKFIVTYSGNIGHSQNIEMLAQTAKMLLDNKDILFVVIGEGARKETLLKLVEENKLTNVKVLPFQDYADISHVFSLGDCGLVISKKGTGANSLPSKTWSIMSSQRAVIASFDKGTDLDRILTQSNCGVCIEPDDATALKEAVEKLYMDREMTVQMGKNGREYILNNLTKEIGTANTIKVLKSVL
ncbi:MAG: glycosyltransferase family 4 protein [Clostridia bacterium]|nr:glycosyltransferase family 4 protein [Clostridia bacterium]